MSYIGNGPDMSGNGSQAEEDSKQEHIISHSGENNQDNNNINTHKVDPTETSTYKQKRTARKKLNRKNRRQHNNQPHNSDRYKLPIQNTSKI